VPRGPNTSLPQRAELADRHGGLQRVLAGCAPNVLTGVRASESRDAEEDCLAMAFVDPDDDDIERWVVWHFRYDPAHGQRRNVVVAAFDNIDEFHAEITERAAQLAVRKDSDDAVDRRERIGGHYYERGYRRRWRNARNLRRGALPAELVDDLDLPSSVAVARAHRDDDDDD
jgi:hypothetical protein